MRTWFEIEETDVYLMVRDTLPRRCETWAAARGLVVAPMLAEALPDSRQFNADGRLAYWTPVQVERALLHWIPGKADSRSWPHGWAVAARPERPTPTATST